MASVDIVVPCYNYARFLECCVNSILSQRDVDVRVLIIDDVSSDETEAVGRRLASLDERVSFWRHEKNLGLVGTLNDGIFNWASAPYLLALSADDALAPGALARACAVLDKHPEIGMVYGIAKIITAEGITEEAPDDLNASYQIISGGRFIERCCKEGNPVASPAAIVRMAMQRQLGEYFAPMPHTCDMEMWMRFAAHRPIGVLQNVQAYYRWHGMNMNIAYASGAVGDARERIATCHHIYDNWGGANIAGFREWVKEMELSLAKQAIWMAGKGIERGDHTMFDACVTFVNEYAPELHHTPAWRRLQVKKVLGSRAARIWRSAWNRTRDVKPQSADTSAQIGWWPETVSAIFTLDTSGKQPSVAVS